MPPDEPRTRSLVLGRNYREASKWTRYNRGKLEAAPLIPVILLGLESINIRQLVLLDGWTKNEIPGLPALLSVLYWTNRLEVVHQSAFPPQEIRQRSTAPPARRST